MASARVSVNTTLDYEVKTEMEAAGLNFSTALSIGCQELLTKRTLGKTSAERADSLARLLRQVSAGLPEGLTLGAVADKGKELGVQ